MDDAHNLILVGGTGKTHLATALDVAAIHHGKRSIFQRHEFGQPAGAGKTVE